ncbi:efflux RND transporter permease subunit [Lewinella sp. 4G2]|uniref:efflux RND transporter permease subunit n=1 Tax=Lewinella sp. 4G2 TaxID=1803372 RepID=UPI0007B4CB42|nr:efflux RND transporter permease subunit [Lewinella sp. 4G2]OAV43686.1 hypothetical protein A3850_003865 [Lewinella sp. 4G2]
MRKLIKFFIEHPTIVNLCVLLIVGLGAMTLLQTDTSYLPKAKVRFIDVAVVYPGATPEQVEEGIILKLEEELEGLEGIDRISSASSPSLGTVAIELLESADEDVALSLVKNAVDKINTFPRGSEPPIVDKRDVKDLAMAVAVTGDVSLQTKKDVADEIEKDLLNLPGISDIVMSGAPEQEIEISVAESQLRAYGLTFGEVAAAVSSTNLETFGGEIKTGTRNINIKADDKGYFARDLQNLIVRTNPDGSVIFLRDVATVRDQFKDQPGKRYLSEEESIVLNVFAMGNENILTNADATLAYVNDFNASREGVQLTIVEDGSETVRENIDTMTNNGIAGFVLVLLVLALFLDKYLAFWVALKIPVAIIGMFLLSGIQDLTINVVSLFAFVIVLGILVDDGVVIGENIFQWAKKKGITPAQAALEGTMEMVTPVLISLGTTATAFSMFLFLPTQTGEFFGEMAFVVIAVLVIAVLDTFFFLPAHLAHSRALRKDNTPSRVERWFNNSVEWVNVHLYQPTFRFFVTKWKLMPYATVLVFFGLLISAFGLMGSGVVGFTFFPNLDDKAVFIELDMPPGTPVEVTTEKLLLIQDAAEKANVKLRETYGKDMIRYVETITGPRANQGKLRVTYVSSEQRDISSFELTEAIRDEAPDIPEATGLVYGIGATNAVFGKPVSVALRGKDLGQLRAARDELKASMLTRDDIKDVSDTDQTGVQEAIVRLNPAGERLGLTAGSVMNQIRAAFFGVEAQRLQRGDEEIEVWLRYPRDGRQSEAQLADMRINAPGGGSYPLSEVAYFEYGTANQVINRLAGEREIRVEANVANPLVSAPAVIGALEGGPLAAISEKYPTVAYSAEGQSRESAKMGEGAGLVFPVIMIVMLALIVLAFNSFSQALITFSLYPFAFIGVILGHWIQGEALNVFSIIGTIALIGVFTNNSLVLVSTLNQLLEEGMDFFAAVREATASRFRPILLTTVTTVAGLAPLLASNSLGAQFLKGPAIAMAYGLSFGLLNVLFLLPALLVILNGGRRLMKRIKTLNKVKATPEQVEPAVRAKAFRLNLPATAIVGAVAGAMLMGGGTGLSAQSVAPTLSLTEATTLALANNPRLKSLGYDRELSRNNVNPAVAGIGPQIILKGQALIGYGDTRVETVNLGPPGSENPPLELNGFRSGIIVQPEANWLVYDGGAGRARLEQLRLVDGATALAIENAREETVARVTRTYLAAARLQTQLVLTAENIELSQDRLTRALRDESYGQSNSLRSLQARVDLSTDSAAYRNLSLEVANLKRALNQQLGRDPETALAFQPPRNLRPRPLPFDSLMVELIANNENLAQARQRIKLSEQGLALTETARKPQIQLYANANYLNQRDDANFLLQNRNFGAEAGARVSYTLFDGGLRTIKAQNARIELEQSQVNRDNTELELRTLLRQAHATYDNSRAQLAYEQANLPVFEANFNKTRTDYRNGQADATVLRAAQLNLNAAKTRIALERFSVLQAEVELLRLTGGLVR